MATEDNLYCNTLSDNNMYNSSITEDISKTHIDITNLMNNINRRTNNMIEQINKYKIRQQS